MSWSITIDRLQQIQDDVWSLPEVRDAVEVFVTQHPKYPEDMARAFELAKAAGFASCVLTGFRTPSPYGGDEVVDISVRGLMKATDYQQEILRFIMSGPQETT